ncbi:FadR family transcriptional regulator [Corynebacterium aquatimens]|uniref:FadR/GntR family transcriptional regulator n=1 Tax=Corynebacterium TaxID=1716 RepID=UPI001F411475|nr:MULTISPECIES: GntR family transcriptional regulator [Corynebacterium]QYH19617.1 FadR family transcriptional regulator [Corynebacterium aquatimens]UIZ91402.1 FadR family transcriptional regulator [Corynebacterium sp. CNCTC7651]
MAQKGILDYIRTNQLQPGDSLPSEAALCGELGLSRTSVREAMQTLSSLDIVEVRHGHGTYVSKMSMAPLIQGMTLRILLDADRSLATLGNIVDLRSAIDHSLAQELARIWSSKDSRPLLKIVERMEEEHAAGRSFAKFDQQFHQTLLADIANPLLVELSDALWEIHMATLPMLQVPVPEDMHVTMQMHREIVNRLTDGDVAGYHAVVDKHYAPLRRTIETETP